MDVQHSAYEINYQDYYNQGYRGVLFDIDNTLVEHGVPANSAAIMLFEELHAMGWKTCLLSNNSKERVHPFAELVCSDYMCKANKPSPKHYLEAVKKMELLPEQVLFIGDQIFTDIWGANRAGLYSVLTHPINPKEEIQIILKRIPEKWVLFFYKRYKKGKEDKE